MVREPLAELRDVSKVHAGGQNPVAALRNVSLTLERGEYLAIVGPSGSGKSTLLNILGCLDVATEGSYTLFGQDVRRLSRAELADLRNQRLGFVFQSFHLLPRLTAWQNVELPLLYRGLPGAERHQRVRRALDAVGLSARHDHRPNALSGGEQQRVAIARALVGQPDLIIADEPTGNLDQARGEEIMRIFESLHQTGQTLVLVTHDAAVAKRARRRIELRDGAITLDERTP